jgi:hypothetical protein
MVFLNRFETEVSNKSLLKFQNSSFFKHPIFRSNMPDLLEIALNKINKDPPALCKVVTRTEIHFACPRMQN